MLKLNGKKLNKIQCIYDTLDLAQSNQVRSRSGIKIILEQAPMVRNINTSNDSSPWYDNSIKLAQSQDKNLNFDS